MEQPKISLIVPVYKAEAYLPCCLDSLLAQTHRNLEIILVDDGSPDNCGTICEAYAARDSRIQVIRQENAGVAQARNAGLAAVTGDWIGWVDSDDWIEPDMYEKLLAAALKNDAPIAMCGARMHYPDSSVPYNILNAAVLERDAFMTEYIRDRQFHDELWSKLWKRELFCGLRFPQVLYFEDRALVWRLLHRAGKVAVIPDELYHYRKTGGSITMDLTLKKTVVFWQVLHQRNLEMAELYPQLLDTMFLSELVSMKQTWAYAWIDRKNRTPQDDAVLREMAAFSRQHRHLIRGNRAYRPVERLSVWLTGSNSTMAYFLAAKTRAAYLFVKRRIWKK